MNTLQSALESVLSEVPRYFLTPLIQEKLSQQGVKVTTKQAQKLASQIMAGKAPSQIPGKRVEPVTLSLDKNDADLLFERISKFFETDLEALILSVIDKSAPILLKGLMERWPQQRGYEVRELTLFRQRLAKRWWVGLNKIRMLTTIARDLGNEINRAIRDERLNADTPLVEVLTRLHARSCQVTEEIIVLMEQGFANGAMARWRTLHEIVVTSLFISDQGTECAQRYIDHEIVESYRAATDYEECRGPLGYPPISEKELLDLLQRRDAMIGKYGSPFGGQYGWSAEALKMKKPTFKDLEMASDNAMMRSHYRMASHGVHANPKGIYFSFASLFPMEVLLAGPSNAGLADAGALTARSLLLITATLLPLSPSIDHQVAFGAMRLVAEKTGPAFLRADRKLEREEQALRKAEREG